MQELLLSVVIPIYNVEQYLEQMVDSVLKQTFDNFELILVNDGSTDRSGEICNEYQKKDERVKVLHQTNGGHTRARKVGVESAAGKYVMILDSDDQIDLKMFEKMISCAEQNDDDIVIVGFIKEYNNRTELFDHPSGSGVFEGNRLKEIWKTAIYSGKYYSPGIAPALWNKLFKRNIISYALSKVDDTIRIGEDAVCSYLAIAYSKRIEIIPKYYPYHYKFHESSISYKYDVDYFKKVSLIQCILKNNFIQLNNKEMIRGLGVYIAFMIEVGIQTALNSARKENQESHLLLRYMCEKCDMYSLIQDISCNDLPKYVKRKISLLKKKHYKSLILLEKLKSKL